MAAALASPCRIKQKRRWVRRPTSGRTVYAYVGGNPISLVDPYGLHCLSTTTQKTISAAAAGTVFGGIFGKSWQGAVIGGVLGAAGGYWAAQVESYGMNSAVAGSMSSAATGALEGIAQGNATAIGINAVAGAAGGGMHPLAGQTLTGGMIGYATGAAGLPRGLSGMVGGAAAGYAAGAAYYLTDGYLKETEDCGCEQ